MTSKQGPQETAAAPAGTRRTPQAECVGARRKRAASRSRLVVRVALDYAQAGASSTGWCSGWWGEGSGRRDMFDPTVANAAAAPAPAPEGMVWIPGGEFSMGANDPPDMNDVGTPSAS